MPNQPVTRFSVSLEPELLARLDAMVEAREMPSRSAAIAEMIHAQLTEHHQHDPHQVFAGTLTVVYREDRRNLRVELSAIERKYLKEVIATQHVFLENAHNLEVLLVQGPAGTLQALRQAIIALSGVTTAELTLTSALLPPLH